NLARSAQGDAKAKVVTAATQVRGVHQGVALGVHLRYEGVAVKERCWDNVAAVRSVEGISCRGEHCRVGEPGHVGLARGVNGNVIGVVVKLAAQEGGVDQSAAAAVQLGYEDVVGAPGVVPLERSGGRREVRRVRVPRDVCVSGPVDGDARAAVAVGALAAPQVG